MNVIPAWKEGVTGKGIVVTILDDGLESDHPDLMNSFVSIQKIQIFLIPSDMLLFSHLNFSSNYPNMLCSFRDAFIIGLITSSI